jgi:hypothetical protein
MKLRSPPLVSKRSENLNNRHSSEYKKAMIEQNVDFPRRLFFCKLYLLAKLSYQLKTLFLQINFLQALFESTQELIPFFPPSFEPTCLEHSVPFSPFLVATSVAPHFYFLFIGLAPLSSLERITRLSCLISFHPSPIPPEPHGLITCPHLSRSCLR